MISGYSSTVALYRGQHLLGAGYHVIVEGILHTSSYDAATVEPTGSRSGATSCRR